MRRAFACAGNRVRIPGPTGHRHAAGRVKQHGAVQRQGRRAAAVNEGRDHCLRAPGRHGLRGRSGSSARPSRHPAHRAERDRHGLPGSARSARGRLDGRAGRLAGRPDDSAFSGCGAGPPARDGDRGVHRHGAARRGVILLPGGVRRGLLRRFQLHHIGHRHTCAAVRGAGAGRGRHAPQHKIAALRAVEDPGYAAPADGLNDRGRHGGPAAGGSAGELGCLRRSHVVLWFIHSWPGARTGRETLYFPSCTR